MFFTGKRACCRFPVFDELAFEAKVLPSHTADAFSGFVFERKRDVITVDVVLTSPVFVITRFISYFTFS